MRGKRSKQYRKLMQQYGLAFGFREPYQVLIDAQMVEDTSRFKMDVLAGLTRTLHGQVKPMMTQCSIRHLYTLPTTPTLTQNDKNVFIDLAKTFERRRCNHHTLENPLSTLDCYKDVVDPKGSGRNKNCYVLASQDESVRRWARSIKGVPSVYVKRSVMVMEPMAEGSLGAREGLEKGKLRGGVRKPSEGKRKRDDGDEAKDGEDKERETKKVRKIKGLKGPNPLSVKKSKRKVEGGEVGGSVTKVLREESGLARSKTNPVPKTNPVTDGLLDEIETVQSDKKRRKRTHKSGSSAKTGILEVPEDKAPDH